MIGIYGVNLNIVIIETTGNVQKKRRMNEQLL